MHYKHTTLELQSCINGVPQGTGAGLVCCLYKNPVAHVGTTESLAVETLCVSPKFVFRVCARVSINIKQYIFLLSSETE